MDWFDRRIVEYVLTWAPYGRRMDEDVFPTFEMAPRQLWARFTAIVTTLTASAGDLNDCHRALVARARDMAPPVATRRDCTSRADRERHALKPR